MCNMFLEILSKFKLALYYLINSCLIIATSRSCCTSRNFFFLNASLTTLYDNMQCRSTFNQSEGYKLSQRYTHTHMIQNQHTDRPCSRITSRCLPKLSQQKILAKKFSTLCSQYLFYILTNRIRISWIGEHNVFFCC